MTKNPKYDSSREARKAARHANDNAFTALFDEFNAHLTDHENTPAVSVVPYADPSLSTPMERPVSRRQVFTQPLILFHGIYTGWWWYAPPPEEGN